ncbi:MAG TPA: type II secretion system F family protein [Terracidiphilus sp.]|jgi:tight adherence protein B
MGLIIGLVFIGVFTLIALPLAGMGPSSSAKQALATLDSAIKVERRDLLPQKLNVRKNELLSSIPWLNEKLLKFELTPYLRRLLSQADLDWSAGRLLVICAAGFVIPTYALMEFTNNTVLAFAAGGVLGALPYGFVLFKRHRRFSAFEKHLPEALDLMVSGLRAGHSLLAAMALVARECAAPVNSEFKICFEEQNYGLEMKAALENLIARVPLQDLMITTTAILIQKESGGNLAEVLDKTSYVIRERFRLKRQIMVHTAQGRFTGLILTLLPVVLGVGIYFVDPGMISILWHRDIGIKLMWAAAGLISFGGFVIWKIVDIDV